MKEWNGIKYNYQIQNKRNERTSVKVKGYGKI